MAHVLFLGKFLHIVKFGYPLLELALEQYAIHICDITKNIIMQQETKTEQELKNELLKKKISGDANSTLRKNKPNEKKQYDKETVIKYCFSNPDVLNNAENQDMTNGINEAKTLTMKQVLYCVHKGDTAFAQTIRHLLERLEKVKDNSPQMNRKNKLLRDYIIIDKDHLFTDDELAHFKQINDEQGITDVNHSSLCIIL